MSVKISEMVQTSGAVRSDTLMELATPNVSFTGYDTRSVKVGTLTGRFTFSGTFDTATEFDKLFLSIPIEHIVETTGYPAFDPSLNFVGIGSGSIDVHIAVAESVNTVFDHIRTGAGTFKCVYNDGAGYMTYYIAEDMNNVYGGAPWGIPVGNYIGNGLLTAVIPPVLTQISTSSGTHLDMRFEIRTGSYTDPITAPLYYHGYADIFEARYNNRE